MMKHFPVFLRIKPISQAIIAEDKFSNAFHHPAYSRLSS